MKLLLLTPIFKRFKKSTFFSSLNQNSCPVYDAEEIKKQEQQEAIKKLYPKKKAYARMFGENSSYFKDLKYKDAYKKLLLCKKISF